LSQDIPEIAEFINDKNVVWLKGATDNNNDSRFCSAVVHNVIRLGKAEIRKWLIAFED
jgi:hypothetical protein